MYKPMDNNSKKIKAMPILMQLLGHKIIAWEHTSVRMLYYRGVGFTIKDL